MYISGFEEKEYKEYKLPKVLNYKRGRLPLLIECNPWSEQQWRNDAGRCHRQECLGGWLMSKLMAQRLQSGAILGPQHATAVIPHSVVPPPANNIYFIIF